MLEEQKMALPPAEFSEKEGNLGIQMPTGGSGGLGTFLCLCVSIKYVDVALREGLCIRDRFWTSYGAQQCVS